MRKSRKKEKLEQEENNWKDLDQQTNKTELKKFKEVKKNLLKRRDERIKDAKKQTIKQSKCTMESQKGNSDSDS